MFDDHHRRCAAVVLILAFGTPGRAVGQQVASSLDQLRELASVGDNVIVTDLAGQQTRGRISDISSLSLSLLAGGTRTTFAPADIDTITERDSRWNGTLWGLAAGAVLGLTIDHGLVKQYGRDDISGRDSAAFVVESAAVGAGIGFAIDAMIRGNRLIFSHKTRREPAGVASPQSTASARDVGARSGVPL